MELKNGASVEREEHLAGDCPLALSLKAEHLTWVSEPACPTSAESRP